MASTVTSSHANSAAFWRLIKKEVNRRHASPLAPRGIFPFVVSETVATTSIDDVNDEVRLVKFPDRCYLIALQVTATDMDTNATPTLRFDVQVDDDSTEVDLIANSTVGQGGGSDELDEDAGHLLREVSNKYLQIKVDAVSATPASGTLTFKGLVYIEAPTTL